MCIRDRSTRTECRLDRDPRFMRFRVACSRRGPRNVLRHAAVHARVGTQNAGDAPPSRKDRTDRARWLCRLLELQEDSRDRYVADDLAGMSRAGQVIEQDDCSSLQAADFSVTHLDLEYAFKLQIELTSWCAMPI